MAELKFDTLWAVHPTNNNEPRPCKNELGGTLYPNQCAIRMGVCLKRAGIQPGMVRGGATCAEKGHGPNEMHFLAAVSVANGIEGARAAGIIQNVGPIYRVTDPINFYKDPNLYGKKGMMFFGDYWRRSGETWAQRSGDHIDLWDGYRTTASWLMEWFYWLGYYGNYQRTKQIWFWEVR